MAFIKNFVFNFFFFFFWVVVVVVVVKISILRKTKKGVLEEVD